MKNIVIIIVMLSCASASDENKVIIAGNLKQIMTENEIEGVMNLYELKTLSHLYALGAVENLDGEILVWDGQPMVSKVVSDSIQVQQTFDTNAALLVYAKINEWQTYTIENDLDLQELEKFISEKASQRDQPFPFLINGVVKDLDWHVVAGQPKDHTGHSGSGFKSNSKNVNVDVLGFYSEHHHGVFTHHGTNTHMHVKNYNSSIAGHIDNIVVKKNSTLLLPKPL